MSSRKARERRRQEKVAYMEMLREAKKQKPEEKLEKPKKKTTKGKKK